MPTGEWRAMCLLPTGGGALVWIVRWWWLDRSQRRWAADVRGVANNVYVQDIPGHALRKVTDDALNRLNNGETVPLPPDGKEFYWKQRR